MLPVKVSTPTVLPSEPSVRRDLVPTLLADAVEKHAECVRSDPGGMRRGRSRSCATTAFMLA